MLQILLHVRSTQMRQQQVLGYQRTLQASDLWKLDEAHTATFLSAKLDESWARRKLEADAWNARLEKGLIRPSLVLRLSWFFQALLSGNDYTRKLASLEERWREIDGRKKPSLAFALNDTIGLFFWTGSLFKVCLVFASPWYFSHATSLRLSVTSHNLCAHWWSK